MDSWFDEEKFSSRYLELKIIRASNSCFQKYLLYRTYKLANTSARIFEEIANRIVDSGAGPNLISK